MNEKFELITKHMVMERHLNPFNNMFGGVVLSWLDEACGIYAMEKTHNANIATVSMRDVNFKNPGKTGDNVGIYAHVSNIKNSSIEVKTEAIAYDVRTAKKKIIISCFITFVCLNEEHRPFPYFKKNEYGVQLKKELGF